MKRVGVLLFFLILIGGLFFVLRAPSSDSSVKEARSLFKKGELDQAIALLEQVEKPQAEVLAYLGTLLSLKGEEEKALLYYKQAVELSKDSTRYLNNVAVTYYSLNQDQKARKWFLKVLEIDPQDKRALNYLKKIKIAKKSNDGMMDGLEASLTPKEETFEEYYRVGQIFFKVHKWDLSQKYLEKADSLNARSYGVKASLAKLAYRRFDTQAAAAYWAQAQSLEPDKVEPFIEAGRLYAAMAQYQQAALCWNRVNQLSPLGSPEKQEAQYYLKSLAPFLP